MTIRAVSVRVELTIEDTHHPTDLDRKRRQLAQAARDALERRPEVVDVVHASTVLRKPGSNPDGWGFEVR